MNTKYNVTLEKWFVRTGKRTFVGTILHKTNKATLFKTEDGENKWVPKKAIKYIQDREVYETMINETHESDEREVEYWYEQGYNGGEAPSINSGYHESYEAGMDAAEDNGDATW